jgi:hypothetical protein
MIQAQPGSKYNSPMRSVSNDVADFAVRASSDTGESITVNSQGGEVRLRTGVVRVTPWKSVYWERYGFWVIFLANVTAQDFTIAFLYLFETSKVRLSVFNYATGSSDLISMTGTFQITGKTVKTATQTMPILQLRPEAKTENRLWAFGANIYITSSKGTLLLGNESLSIYPLRNQLGVEGGVSNELWALITDSRGAYYFAIAYMSDEYKSNVLLGHILRLNDYASLPSQSLEAEWSKEPFTCLLEVTVGFPNVTLTVDGFPFLTDASGMIQARLPAGIRTVEIPLKIIRSENTRVMFKQWSDGETERIRQVELSRYREVALKAIYSTQYLLSIENDYGRGIGKGWYYSGTAANISINPTIDFGNRSRLIFTGWSGDIWSPSPEASVHMGSPKVIRANWKWQYECEINIAGLPSGAEVVFVANGLLFRLQTPVNLVLWLDFGSQPNLVMVTRDIGTAQGAYTFQGWRTATGIVLSDSFTVMMPETIEAYFTQILNPNLS